MNLTVNWRSLLGTCELIHIFVCKDKTAVIMLKILGATVQNLGARATWHQGFMHPCYEALCCRNLPITKAYALVQFSSVILKGCIFDGVPLSVLGTARECF